MGVAVMCGEEVNAEDSYDACSKRQTEAGWCKERVLASHSSYAVSRAKTCC